MEVTFTVNFLMQYGAHFKCLYVCMFLISYENNILNYLSVSQNSGACRGKRMRLTACSFTVFYLESNVGCPQNV